MNRILKYILLISLLCSLGRSTANAQINAEQVLRVGQNTLYLEDYVLSIQYFNQVIAARPYWAQPYFFRSIAKISLDDFRGAEEDASKAIELNPFITNAYEVRGVARQNLGRPAEAIEDYKKALEQLPENRGLMLNKALAEEEIKDFEAARKSFDRLLEIYPRYDNGYIGRARLLLETSDTTAAIADIDRALEINKNNVNAHVMHADIAINSAKDYEGALRHMDEAIKLQPQYAGFFINRAYLRYNLDDYFGAMADFDYALQLDPTNVAALFNRGLLRGEVHDTDKSIADFTRVLQLEPDNYKALYNRAMLYQETGNHKLAIADLDRVIEAFPSFAGAYFARCENYRMIGDQNKAKRDYDRSMALSRGNVNPDEGSASGAIPSGANAPMDETQEQVAARFTALLTVDDNARLKEEYATEGIKGRVQDRNSAIEIEPMFTLSYYITSTELKEVPYYLKEVDELNATRLLRFVAMVTNHAPQITDEDVIARHFSSINYYNSYITMHKPRAIDYFGRAMDHYTLHNYTAAIEDLSRAIELTPDFALAYLLRADARIQAAEADKLNPERKADNVSHSMPGVNMSRINNAEAMADIDRVIELSPRMAFAHYNKGNLLVENGDLTSAIAAYTHAIELKPDLGEAYYNRGYLYLKLGNKDAGIADLSKAGELGIVPSYNLLKRITR